MSPSFHHGIAAEIDPVALYRILWLRVGVFVVEQEAAYPEIDGRDIEPGAELMWAEDAGAVVSTLRILRDIENLRIGRVATAPAVRGQGVAAELIRRAIVRCGEIDPAMPVDLDAQAQLAGWYARFGFEVSGDAFVEDGIRHLPMRRG